MSRFIRLFASIVFAGVLIGLLSTPAHADPTSHMAHPDGVDFADVPDSKDFTVYQGEYRLVSPLANDVVPEGVDVQVCRFQEPDPTYGIVQRVDNYTLAVYVNPDAMPEGGTFTFRYWNCDETDMSESTVTITVKQTLPVKVRKLRRDGQVVPGKLVAVNPNDVRAHVVYGSYRRPQPDGMIHVPAGSKKIFKVARKEIDWEAYLGPRWVYASNGHVSNIKLPARTTVSSRSATMSVSERALQHWGSNNKR